jgi:hypothetical protein
MKFDQSVADEVNRLVDRKLAEKPYLTCCEVNEIVLEFVGKITLQFSQSLWLDGYSVDEINKLLIEFMPEMDRWRNKTLKQLMRRMEERQVEPVTLH